MRRSTLHRAVKNKRVTVQGPVKKPQMDSMSHRGGGGRDALEGGEGTPLCDIPRSSPPSRAPSLCPATVSLTASVA